MAAMIEFTDEQKEFLKHAKAGKDVLVDACIGSGKTTSIQAACDELQGKSILYLTYNRRLLEEARKRIPKGVAMVHTFHSFAGTMLTAANVYAGSEHDVIPMFVSRIKRVLKIDTVIVDEYQDISEDLKDMLWHLCRISYESYGFVPQFLIVGDKDQKISDYTSINAVACVHELMDFLDHAHGGEHVEMQFTNCFRLNAEYAEKIGQAWNKSIIGLNTGSQVMEMHVGSVANFLSQFEPEDILVLGNNMSWGTRVAIQNELERRWPEKFNKDTVYSSISEYDSDRRGMDASKCAIFTTFDSAKGLERKVCVICNYDNGYLKARMNHQTARTVLKNLFLVAASRGKDYNVFCYKGAAEILDFGTVGRISGSVPVDMRVAYISDLYDYKLKEDVDSCISCLEISSAGQDLGDIAVRTKVGQIDISMCQGIYAQAVYFRNYDIELAIDIAWNERTAKGNHPRLPAYDKAWPLWKKVLFLVALETGQERYVTQVTENYVDEDDEQSLIDRLSAMFDPFSVAEKSCTIVYKDCRAHGVTYGDKLLRGRADLMVRGIPWELKLVTDLKPEHALQVALYAVATGADYGMVYNIRTGETWRVDIPDKSEFLKRTLRCLSKRELASETAVISGEAIAIDHFAAVDSSESMFDDLSFDIGDYMPKEDGSKTIKSNPAKGVKEAYGDYPW